MKNLIVDQMIKSGRFMMKQCIQWTLIGLMIVIISGIGAANTFGAESTISTNLYGDSAGMLNATWEMPMTTTGTFFLTGKIYQVKSAVTVSGFGLDAGVNFYLNRFQDGVYIGAGLSIASTTISGGTYNFPQGFWVTGNLQAGYKKIFVNGFTIQAGYNTFNGLIAGVGYSF
jgi:hypothetical protein